MVRHAAGATVVVNDLIGIVEHARAPMRLVLTLMGVCRAVATGPARLQARAIDDTGLVADQLSQWADLPQLQRIIMSRCTIIDTAPAEVLRLLADTLSPR